MNLDFLSIKPQIGVEEERLYKTWHGALLSVFAIILTILASFYFGREVWEKSNPIVNSLKNYVEVPAKLSLDKKNFDLGFGIDHDYNYINDPSLVTLKSYVLSQKNNSYFTSDFQLIVCDTNSFDEENKEFFAKYPTQGLFCLPNSTSNILALDKSFGQDDFKVLVVEFYPCTNFTNSLVVCQPQETIDEILGQMYFSIYSIDYTVDTSNYASPFIRTLFNDYISLSKDSFVDFTMFISHMSVISDIGFLFKDLTQDDSVTVYSVKNMLSLRKEETGMFLSFGIQLHNYQILYYRKYIKLQELMAQIGGIANLFIIISKLLNYFPSVYSYKIHLVAKYFDFPAPESINLKFYLQKYPNIKYKDNLQPKTLSQFGLVDSKSNSNHKFILRSRPFDSLLMCFKSREVDFLKHFVERGDRILRKGLTIESLIESSRLITSIQRTIIGEKEIELISKMRNSLFLESEDQSFSIPFFGDSNHQIQWNDISKLQSIKGLI